MSESKCPQCGESFDSEMAMGVHRQAAHSVPWQDEETLREAYVEKKLPVETIADQFECEGKTIRKWLDKHGIEKRDAYEERVRGLRRRPASFYTRKDGYERWKTYSDGDYWKVYVHRLLAISEYGFDAVNDKEVHHKNGIPWDNRPENIGLMEDTDHGRMHANERWHS